MSPDLITKLANQTARCWSIRPEQSTALYPDICPAFTDAHITAVIWCDTEILLAWPIQSLLISISLKWNKQTNKQTDVSRPKFHSDHFLPLPFPLGPGWEDIRGSWGWSEEKGRGGRALQGSTSVPTHCLGQFHSGNPPLLSSITLQLLTLIHLQPNQPKKERERN